MMAAGAQAAYKDPNPNISSASVAEAQRAFETLKAEKYTLTHFPAFKG